MKNAVALKHELKKLAEESPLDFAGIDIHSVLLYLDLTEWKQIVEILKKNRPKFKTIIREVLLGRYNDSLYKKEAENVTAMRFSGNPNSRIYCLEVPGKKGGKKKVVMAKALIHKNVQKNDKKIDDLIESIQKTNYEYYEDKAKLPKEPK